MYETNKLVLKEPFYSWNVEYTYFASVKIKQCYFRKLVNCFSLRSLKINRSNLDTATQKTINGTNSLPAHGTPQRPGPFCNACVRSCPTLTTTSSVGIIRPRPWHCWSTCGSSIIHMSKLIKKIINGLRLPDQPQKSVYIIETYGLGYGHGAVVCLPHWVGGFVWIEVRN